MSEPAPYICYACANGRHSDCQEEACKCSHRAQPSHPAAQSETPEIDAQFNECAAMGGKWDRLADLARSLERRLALAQTEIKGHMRVEDELEAELAEAQAQEHGKTYGFICGRFECDESGKYHIFQNEGLERK